MVKSFRITLRWVLGLCLILVLQAVEQDEYLSLRTEMVKTQLAGRDITNPRVLEAMAAVPRHLFVNRTFQHLAYADHPLPIGESQTISQPYIVALMSQLLDPIEEEKILEIGTGSGYQAAVLAHMGAEVYSVEIIKKLAERADEILGRLGYSRVRVRWGDGSRGWEDHAPFDGAMITCATARLPLAVFRQIREGGRIVLPLGDPDTYQTLCVITKRNGEPHTQKVLSVRFVPMTSVIKQPSR